MTLAEMQFVPPDLRLASAEIFSKPVIRYKTMQRRADTHHHTEERHDAGQAGQHTDQQAKLQANHHQSGGI